MLMLLVSTKDADGNVTKFLNSFFHIWHDHDVREKQTVSCVCWEGPALPTTEEHRADMSDEGLCLGVPQICCTCTTDRHEIIKSASGREKNKLFSVCSGLGRRCCRTSFDFKGKWIVGSFFSFFWSIFNGFSKGETVRVQKIKGIQWIR